MADNLSIIVAGRADVEALIAIERAQAEAGEIGEPDEAGLRGLLEGARLDDAVWGAVLIARLNGEAAGALTLSFLLDYPAGGEKAFIDNLAVAPNLRGRGIAKRLILTAHHIARVRGCSWIESLAFPDDARARALWDGMGYQTSERQLVRRGLYDADA